MNSTSRKIALSDAAVSAMPGDEPDGEHGERDREPLGRAHAREGGEVDDEQDREHRREADEVRADDGERNELAREARLPDQVRVVEHRPARRLQRRRDERPDGEPREQEQRVVAAVRERRVPDDAEDEQVDGHQQQRVGDRPDDAQRRAAVLRLEVAAEEVAEQLAVAVDVDVTRCSCAIASARRSRLRA